MIDAVEFSLVDTGERPIPVEDSPLQSVSPQPSARQCNHMDCVGVNAQDIIATEEIAATGRKNPWPTSFPNHLKIRPRTFFSRSAQDFSSTSFSALPSQK